MLRVDLTDEPHGFNAKVRVPGEAWFKARHIDPNKPLPEKTEIKPYWKECVSDLRTAFDGQCCYTGRYMYASEVIPVEHALPKSLRPDLAYEWSNYRYASSRINSRKGKNIILDPADLPCDMDVYHLEFATGAIFVNPAVKKEHPGLFFLADLTLKGLHLDDALYRAERMEIWGYYIKSSKGQPERDLLKKTNNFVWSEASRQNLL